MAEITTSDKELESSDKEIIRELQDAYASMKEQLDLVVVGQEELITGSPPTVW